MPTPRFALLLRGSFPLVLIASAGLTGCNERVPLGNGTELLRVDSDEKVICCESNGWRILPEGGLPGSTIAELTRLPGHAAVVGRCTNPEYPNWVQLFVIIDCDTYETFTKYDDRDAYLTERNLPIPELDSFERPFAVLRRGGFK